MARPKTTKTTLPGSYPRYPLGRTRYVTTDRKGNRQVTNVNGVFVLAGQGLLALGAILLGMFVVAVLVVLGVGALIGLAVRSAPMKRAPKAWVSLWAGIIRGWFR
jgi:hypothetical protein